ncbi:MAG: SDR family oxidoreductase [Geminicoccaceae bacterium]|nr:MAG: SDR family oxidoreductase [Geminicoccaceae bacterium]
MSYGTDLFRLDDLHAAIVGGSSGIGLEIARGYRAVGARVSVVGRDPQKLRAVDAEFGGTAAKPAAYAGDMRDLAAIRAMADRLEADHGAIDVLVACQGTTVIKPVLELSEAEYDAVLDTNLKSVFFTCQEIGRRMVARRRGAIVTIASLAAHNGWANAAAYAASKWGVVGLTQTLAAEWGEAGVRVNSIAPGFFLTDMNRDRMPEARKAEASRRNAMHRMGELGELVGAAIYLASPAAGFVTGATLRVDGGYLASGI